MTITRIEVESTVVRSLREFLTIMGKSVVIDGTNPDVNDALAFALRRSGFVVASRLDVTDLDMALIPDNMYDQILDLTKYSMLLDMVGSMTLVDNTAGPFTDKNSQAYKPLKDLWEYYIKRIGDLYGMEIAEPVGGVITMDFVSHNDRVQ